MRSRWKKTTSWHWLLLPSNWCHDTRPLWKMGVVHMGNTAFIAQHYLYIDSFFSSCMASVTQARMQMSVRVGDDTSACLGLWMHSIFCFSGLFPPSENRRWVLIFSEALHPPSAFLSLVVLYLRTDIHFCVFHAAVCAWMPAFFKPQQSGFDHSGVGLAFSFLLLLF